MKEIVLSIPPHLLKQGEDIVLRIKVIETAEYSRKETSYTLFNYIGQVIDLLKQKGQERTAETYQSTFRSFKNYRKGRDLPLSEIDCELIAGYEGFLKSKQLTKNTTSFYMRILRATYNRAVRQGFVGDRHPFQQVYTGVDKTQKRAITSEELQCIEALQLADSEMAFARDLFLFSFYTRGMAFVDVALLKKSDLRDGVLHYRRKKTGQLLFIKWKQCMQEIVNRYPSADGIHLFPIINGNKKNPREQYKRKQGIVGRRLVKLGKMLDLNSRLTFYAARHSWASIAKALNIPTAVISDGMGHNSEKTTQIYLAQIDVQRIDEANDKIINMIHPQS